MLSVLYKLRQVWFSFFTDFSLMTPSEKAINLFISSVDHHYGPITTIQREGRILKHIPWSAFALSEGDWERVKEAREILDMCECYHPILYKLTL